MRGVCGARREVDEERLVGHERLLLADPVDRPIRHVVGEVVALFRRPVRLNRRRAVVDGGRVLVRLSGDEAVEVLEASSAGRPSVEGPEWARLPHRHLMALPELRRRVAVQLERLGQRRRSVRTNRVVAGSRRGDLGDSAHSDRVMVSAGEERLPRRRAECCRVKAVVLEPVYSKPLRGRRGARSAECARCAEPDVVEQDDEDVGGSLRRPERLDGRELRVRVLGIFVHRPCVGLIRDRKVVAGGLLGHVTSFRGGCADTASLLLRAQDSRLSWCEEPVDANESSASPSGSISGPRESSGRPARYQGRGSWSRPQMCRAAPVARHEQT